MMTDWTALVLARGSSAMLRLRNQVYVWIPLML
eukprot:SAG31_NODE_14928_length_780_cov_1.046990_1_plen_32_part_10